MISCKTKIIFIFMVIMLAVFTVNSFVNAATDWGTVLTGQNSTANTAATVYNAALMNWDMGVENVKTPVSVMGMIRNVITGNNPTAGSGLSDARIYDIVTALMRWLLVLIGILAIIAFVISGILYLTSAGSEDQVGRAKRMMIYGVIGTVISLAGIVIITAIDRALRGQMF